MIAGFSTLYADDYYYCTELGPGCYFEGCWSAVYPVEKAECIFWCYETGYGWRLLGCLM